MGHLVELAPAVAEGLDADEAQGEADLEDGEHLQPLRSRLEAPTGESGGPDGGAEEDSRHAAKLTQRRRHLPNHIRHRNALLMICAQTRAPFGHRKAWRAFGPGRKWAQLTSKSGVSA